MVVVRFQQNGDAHDMFGNDKYAVSAFMFLDFTGMRILQFLKILSTALEAIDSDGFLKILGIIMFGFRI